MFYKKKGLPEVNDVVICTVKKVLPNSVFVEMDEYGKEGMVHISEVSPGRIRNIRDFVVEGKKIICKVLRINQERGHVDLSLRRVNVSQKMKKNEEYKQEIKSERLIENIGKEFKLNLEQMYAEVGYKVLERYPSLSEGFQEIVTNNLSLNSLGVKEKLAKKIEETIKDKMIPTSVFVKGVFKISTRESNGIEVIKSVLMNLKNKGMSVNYLSAPNYKVSIEDTDYKIAESKLKDAINSSLELAKKLKANAEFIRKNAQ